MGVLTQEVAGLPLWAWIVIAAIVLIAVIVIIIIAVSSAKKNKNKSVAVQSENGEPAVEEAADDVAEEDEDESAPVKNNDKVYHISKRKADNRWQIKAAGGAKAIKLFNTQAEAIDYGKQLAENQDARIMIHKEDGSFRKLTYKK